MSDTQAEQRGRYYSSYSQSYGAAFLEAHIHRIINRKKIRNINTDLSTATLSE